MTAPAPDAAADGLESRMAAASILHHVLQGRTPLDEALARAVAREPAQARPEPMYRRDRAFARAMVAISLRRLGQIEAVLASYLAKPLPASSGHLREILLIGAAQLLFLGTPAHAAVSLAVTAVQRNPKSRRFDKLANAVLRRVAENGHAQLAGQDACVLNTPRWLWQRWVMAYGEPTARAIATANMGEAALDISVKADSAHWARVLGGTVLPTGSVRVASAGFIEDLPGFSEGAWWIQDAAATLPARLLGDVASQRIADLCAAPGGKTAALAARGADVTAVDQSAERLVRLRENLTRLQVSATIVEADATTWQTDAPFDSVLLDAPCTATGTIRRHPDIPHLKRATDIPALAALQYRLLNQAATLVRPGGTMIFCTCSLEPEEGPDHVPRFLGHHPGFRLDPVRPGEGGIIADWITPQGTVRTLPCHLPMDDQRLGGLDGFFIARFVRSA